MAAFVDAVAAQAACMQFEMGMFLGTKQRRVCSKIPSRLIGYWSYCRLFLNLITKRSLVIDVLMRYMQVLSVNTI